MTVTQHAQIRQRRWITVALFLICAINTIMGVLATLGNSLGMENARDYAASVGRLQGAPGKISIDEEVKGTALSPPPYPESRYRTGFLLSILSVVLSVGAIVLLACTRNPRMFVGEGLLLLSACTYAVGDALRGEDPVSLTLWLAVVLAAVVGRRKAQRWKTEG